jgi:hypothetical protein
MQKFETFFGHFFGQIVAVFFGAKPPVGCGLLVREKKKRFVFFFPPAIKDWPPRANRSWRERGGRGGVVCGCGCGVGWCWVALEWVGWWCCGQTLCVERNSTVTAKT